MRIECLAELWSDPGGMIVDAYCDDVDARIVYTVPPLCAGLSVATDTAWLGVSNLLAGDTYSVLCVTDLTQTVWSPATQFVAAATSTNLPLPVTSRRFYRVRTDY